MNIHTPSWLASHLLATLLFFAIVASTDHLCSDHDGASPLTRWSEDLFTRFSLPSQYLKRLAEFSRKNGGNAINGDKKWIVNMTTIVDMTTMLTSRSREDDKFDKLPFLLLGSCEARNPMPYLSIDIASYDDKRHCRLKLFIVISSSSSSSAAAWGNSSDKNGEQAQNLIQTKLMLWKSKYAMLAGFTGAWVSLFAFSRDSLVLLVVASRVRAYPSLLLIDFEKLSPISPEWAPDWYNDDGLMEQSLIWIFCPTHSCPSNQRLPLRKKL